MDVDFLFILAKRSERIVIERWISFVYTFTRLDTKAYVPATTLYMMATKIETPLFPGLWEEEEDDANLDI